MHGVLIKGRCPHFRGVLIEGFHCTIHLHGIGTYMYMYNIMYMYMHMHMHMEH